MYHVRHQSGSGLYALTSNKVIKDGQPLNGKFYRCEWKDGETCQPLSYRDATRLARIHGLNMIEWEESKAFARQTQGLKEEVVAKVEAEEKETEERKNLLSALINKKSKGGRGKTTK